MKENIIFSYLLVFIISYSGSFAVDLPDVSLIEDTIREAFDCRKNNPALSVSVVKDGKIVFAEGFGVQNLVDDIPVTNTTLFGIASLTKGFTSTLLAKLTDRSRQYSLNTRIADFYGNNNVFDGYVRSKVTTIRDLLSHRMGIPMHNFIKFDDRLTRKNLIRRIKELRPRGRYRDSFYYSNIMYGQAARLAEKIGRRKYETLIKEELFDKIGMTDSDFFTTANRSTIELAQGYLDVYGELHPVPFELSKRWSELCGASCILSSAVDMAKWMLFNLNHGKNQDGRRVMSEDALEETHKPENVLAKSSLSKYYTKPNVPETFSQTGYALGWRTGHYRGYNMLTHTGSTWGYKNMITLLPDMNVGIYTSMTGDDEDFMFRYSVHQYLADMYMGLTPWLNSSLICSFPEPWFPAKPKRQKPNFNKTVEANRKLDEYLGVYENPAYGKIELFILDEENSTNKLIAEYGYIDLILYPKSKKDEFYFETDGIAEKLINFGTVQFKVNKGGVIDKMRIPSFEPKDPPIFKRVGKTSSSQLTDPVVDNKFLSEQPPTDQSAGPVATNNENTGIVTLTEPESQKTIQGNDKMTKPVDTGKPIETVIENTKVTKVSDQSPDSLSGPKSSSQNTEPSSALTSTDQNSKNKEVETKISDPSSKTEPKQSFVNPKSTDTREHSKDFIKSKTTDVQSDVKKDLVSLTDIKPVVKPESGVDSGIPSTGTASKSQTSQTENKQDFVKSKATDVQSDVKKDFVSPKDVKPVVKPESGVDSGIPSTGTASKSETSQTENIPSPDPGTGNPKMKMQTP